MTSVVVECAYVDLISTAIATFKNPSSDAHQRWKVGLELAAKATGYHTGFWAQFVEEPQTLHVQFAWGVLEDHVNFTRTARFAKLHEMITPSRTDRMSAYHVEMDLAQLEQACHSPVTEVVVAHFSQDVDQDAVAQAWSQTMSQSESITTKNAAHGWTLEDLEHPDLVGVRGKAYFGNIGREISTSCTGSKFGDALQSNLRSITGDTGVKVVTASNPHYGLFVYLADRDAETYVLCPGGQWLLHAKKVGYERNTDVHGLTANQVVQCWQGGKWISPAG